MNLDQRATEDLAKMTLWSQDSLVYARDYGQRKLIWLLKAVRVEVKLENALLTVGGAPRLRTRNLLREGKTMHKNQRVTDMAVDDLARQTGDRATRVRESVEEALNGVPGTEAETEAGRQRRELRDEPHSNEKADQLQEDLIQRRAQERDEKKRAEQAGAWERFMQMELQELELRKGGQLARLLGEPLPGEPPAALERLVLEDQRQAQEGLVALMSGGKVSYKHVEELCEKDMSARNAANRLRTTWLKERQDGWLGRRYDS